MAEAGVCNQWDLELHPQQWHCAGERYALSSADAVFCSLPWLWGERLPSLSSVSVSVTWAMTTRVPKVTVVTHGLGTKWHLSALVAT